MAYTRRVSFTCFLCKIKDNHDWLMLIWHIPIYGMDHAYPLFIFLFFADGEYDFVSVPSCASLAHRVFQNLSGVGIGFNGIYNEFHVFILTSLT